MFTMELNTEDAKHVIEAVNQGIDSRLTGFTKSTFEWVDHGFPFKGGWAANPKLHCAIDESEMEVLLRRLLELGTEEAEMLADDIAYVHYGYETI